MHINVSEADSDHLTGACSANRLRLDQRWQVDFKNLVQL